MANPNPGPNPDPGPNPHRSPTPTPTPTPNQLTLELLSEEDILEVRVPVAQREGRPHLVRAKVQGEGKG